MKTLNDSIFWCKKNKTINIFAYLLSSKKIEKKIIVDKSSSFIIKNNKKEEIKRSKENKKEEKKDKDDFYFDIICPECKSSAIIDINNDSSEYLLNIINCDNLHNLKNIKYNMYDYYDFNFEDLSEDNLEKMKLESNKSLLICGRCSSHRQYMTPPENKLYYCSCGINLCLECHKVHNDPGHYHIPLEDKNYFCIKHNEPYFSYCIDCNSNICKQCVNLHLSESHKLFNFDTIKLKDKDITNLENKIQNQKTHLNNFIQSLKESFNNMICIVESYINSFIKIEKTFINKYKMKYNGSNIWNFQLLRNLSNPNIFDNALFDKLKEFSDKEKDAKKKFDFLNEIYELINKNNKNNKEDKLIKNNIIANVNNEINIKYKIKEKNPINRYVRLFDEIFVKNNKDRFYVQINEKEQNELNVYHFIENDNEEINVFLKEKNIDMPVTDLSYMFNNCKDLKSVDFKKWNFSNITSMEAMFQLCPLEEMPDKIFDFHSKYLENIRAMFCKCVNITSIPDNIKWFSKDNNIRNISMLFSGCKKLISINKQNWFSNKVEDMSYLFNRCEELTEIQMGKLSLENVKNLCGLFNGCKKLKKIPSSIREGNFQNVEDISIMFQGCESIEKLDFKLNNNTTIKNVRNMSGLFSDCYKLKILNGLKNWNTENVKEMTGLFNQCLILESLDLKWNVANVVNARAMFYKCYNLKTIKNLENWRFKDDTFLENIFNQCSYPKIEEIKSFWRRNNNNLKI